jgi:hypothetical protein
VKRVDRVRRYLEAAPVGGETLDAWHGVPLLRSDLEAVLTSPPPPTRAEAVARIRAYLDAAPNGRVAHCLDSRRHEDGGDAALYRADLEGVLGGPAPSADTAVDRVRRYLEAAPNIGILDAWGKVPLRREDLEAVLTSPAPPSAAVERIRAYMDEALGSDHLDSWSHDDGGEAVLYREDMEAVLAGIPATRIDQVVFWTPGGDKLTVTFDGAAVTIRGSGDRIGKLSIEPGGSNTVTVRVIA